MWGAQEGMGWWMLFGGAVWVLFLSSLAYLSSACLTAGTPSPQGRVEASEDIAKRPLAARQISHENYDRIRGTLSR